MSGTSSISPNMEFRGKKLKWSFVALENRFPEKSKMRNGWLGDVPRVDVFCRRFSSWIQKPRWGLLPLTETVGIIPQFPALGLALNS